MVKSIPPIVKPESDEERNHEIAEKQTCGSELWKKEQKRKGERASGLVGRSKVKVE